MKLRLAISIYALCVSIKTTAQGTDLPKAVWLDSNHVRLHISNFDRLLSDAETEVWNPRTQRYECPLPEMLRSHLLVKPPFTHLRVWQKKKSRAYAYPDGYRNYTDTIGRALDRELFDSSRISHLLELQYDTEGRLLRCVRRHFPKDKPGKLTDEDTVQISYTGTEDGSLRIRIRDKHRQISSGGFYTSIYFKQDFSKKRLDLEETREFSYLIGPNTELREFRYEYEVKANGITGNWNGNYVRTFQRDTLGRCVLLADSLIQVRLPLMSRRYHYEQEDVSRHDFWKTSMQIKRWLQQFPQYSIIRRSRSEERFAEASAASFSRLKSPLTHTEETLLLYDAHMRLIGVLPQNPKDPYLTIRQDGRDTLGSYSAWYTVLWANDSSDTTYYQPGTAGEARSLQMGCVVNHYVERPKGTLALRYARIAGSHSIRLKNHARFIEYSTKSESTADHAYWSPAPYRYITDAYPDFILTSPDGRLSYIQDQDNLYKVAYLP